MNEKSKKIVAIGLVIGVLLAALEATIISTAMPQVIMDLGGKHLYSLPFSVYLLSSTVSSVIWGKISDLFNRKIIYSIGIIIFLIGSGLSGLSTSMEILVAMRIIQGIGAGCVTPLTFTINGEMYSVKRRAKVQAYMSAVWGLAGLLGPLLGGLIVDNFSWRYVFYLNIPFGLLALYLVYNYYTEEEELQKTFKLDWIGAVLFVIGSGCLVWGLEQRQYSLIIIGFIAITISWFQERNHPYPLLPIKSLKRALPRNALTLNLLAGMAYFGILAYLPFYVQDVANKGATAAGLVLTPMIVGWTVTNIIAGRLVGKFKLTQMIITGFGLIFIGFLGFIYFYNSSLYYLSSSGFIIGSGMGFSMLSTLLLIQETSHKGELGSSTSGLLFARSIGGAIGVALLAWVIGDALISENLILKQLGFQRAYIACSFIAIVGLTIAITRLKGEEI